MTAKSARKSQTVAFVSPFGVARFPKITSPDTDGKYADNKFKTSIVFDGADVDAVKAALEAAAAKLLPGIDLNDILLPGRLMKDKNKDTGEKTVVGYGINCKSKDRPAVFDAKKNKLPEGVQIGAGSVIRMAGALKAYEKDQVVEGDDGKKRVVTHGLTLWLNDVQVKELVQGAARGTGAAFDEVEGGFEYSAEGGAQEAGDSFGDVTDF